ncbi:hypothetical protein AKJ16_DCAP25756 [Drosera capensis]
MENCRSSRVYAMGCERQLRDWEQQGLGIGDEMGFESMKRNSVDTGVFFKRDFDFVAFFLVRLFPSAVMRANMDPTIQFGVLLILRFR